MTIVTQTEGKSLFFPEKQVSRISWLICERESSSSDLRKAMITQRALCFVAIIKAAKPWIFPEVCIQKNSWQLTHTTYSVERRTATDHHDTYLALKAKKELRDLLRGHPAQLGLHGRGAQDAQLNPIPTGGAFWAQTTYNSLAFPQFYG